MTQEEKFPKSLRDFGYDFDAGGELRQLDGQSGLITNDRFVFNVSADAEYNQKRYEALGKIIDLYVYNLLEQEGLKRLPVPKDGCSSMDYKSFIFASPDVLEKKKVIVLVHGSGVVRAGQWSRRLIINDSLYTGTQISYIRKAKEFGYGVFVLNTNDNYRTIGRKSCKIEDSSNAHEHIETAWKDYIYSAGIMHVAFVAHSYGGECVVKLAEKYLDEFKAKVFAVALTDSVHSIPSEKNEYIVQVINLMGYAPWRVHRRDIRIDRTSYGTLRPLL